MNSQQIRSFTAKVALKAYQAVILDTSVRGQVDLPGGANDPVIGFAVNDADADQDVGIFLVGPVFRGIAGDTSISIGDYVVAEGTDGKLKKLIDDNVLFNACGISLEDGDAEDQVIEIVVVGFKAFTALA